MPVQQAKSPPTDAARFEVHAVEVLQDLREAFLQLIESLPNPTHRAADLDKALGVSRTLGWQVHRVATSPTPLEAGVHVPGSNAVQQVLTAARKAGAPDQPVRNAARAMQAFESMIKQHAGDRATFTTMLNSLVGERTEAIDVKMRRQAFRANSQVWGVQAKTSLRCDLLAPGTSSETIDILSVRGMRDIRRLRTGPPLRLTTKRTLDAHEQAKLYEALGEQKSNQPPGPNLLHEFCTRPIPELDNRFEDGRMDTYLRDMPLGKTGVQTLYLAGISREVEWRSPPGEPNGHTHYAAVDRPIETLVLDTLLHKNLFTGVAWDAEVFGSLDRLGEFAPERFRPEETLPIKPDVLDLGFGPAALPTPHVPRYRDMIESVCADVGWNPRDFQVYRCVMDYPLLSTVLCVKFYFPDHGNW